MESMHNNQGLAKLWKMHIQDCKNDPSIRILVTPKGTNVQISNKFKQMLVKFQVGKFFRKNTI